MRRVVPLFLLLLMASAVPPVSAQSTPQALYMTDTDSDLVQGARLLAATAPSGDAASVSFTPLAGPETLIWATAPQTDDLEVAGDVTVELYFDNGVDANSVTTVELGVAGPDGTITSIDSDEQTAPAETVAHTESFTLDATGTVIPEGSAVTLSVTLDGEAASVTLLFDGADAPSGMESIPLAVLDSDGDGVGDSAERRAGTDPNDASSTPPSSTDEGSGAGTGDGTGTTGSDETGASDDAGPSSEGGSIEMVLASFFLLLSLAIAGFALLGRFTT